MQIFNFRPVGVTLDGGSSIIATFDYQLEGQAIRLHNLKLTKSADGNYRVLPAMTRIQHGDGRTRAYSLGAPVAGLILGDVLSHIEVANAPNARVPD